MERHHTRLTESSRTSDSEQSIGSTCELFEQLWHSGEIPSLSDFLSKHGWSPNAENQKLAVEIVCIDLEFRWRYHEKVTDRHKSNPADHFPSRPRAADYLAWLYGDVDRAIPLEWLATEYRVLSLAKDFAAREALRKSHQHSQEIQSAFDDVDAEEGVAGILAATADFATQPPSDLNNEQFQTRISSPHNASSGDDRYAVIRSHAKGGMGLISIARDNELYREVAFKELQEYCADDIQARARFVREAEITGQLEHPGVVPVYGLGMHPDGRPYYAMRFVKGESFGAQISNFHSSSTRLDLSQSSPAFRSLLGRFVDTCNAIAYAHNRGVIHRDIKPDNIMLGKFGETLVVDWGLAKVIGRRDNIQHSSRQVNSSFDEDTSGTQMGTATGTPAYMSPEQASGQLNRLSPASDVFSLGATLYTLLTGRSPFVGDRVSEVLKKARIGDFQPPKSVNARIPAPLNSICCRAMAKTPAERYASPLELAADIENWLADAEVSAHPDRLIDKSFRWFRRHRTWALAVSFSLGIVAIVSTLAALEINRQRTKAVILSNANMLLAEQEREAKQLATARLRESRNVVDTWLTGFSEASAYYPGSQAFREQMLLQAAEDYEKFVATEESDPEMELERGRTLLRLGDLRRTLLQTESAKQAYDQALTIFQGSNVDLSGNSPPVELAQAELRMAILADDTGNVDEAGKAYQRAIEIGQQLIDRDPSVLAAHLVVAEASSRRAILEARRGNLDYALEILTESAARLEQEKQAFELEEEWIKSLADISVTLGQLHLSMSKSALAKEDFDRAVQSYESLVQMEQDNPRFLELKAGAFIHLATAHRMEGQWEAEASAYKQAIQSYQQLMTAMPDVPTHRENLSLTQTDLGQLLRESYQPSEATVLHQQALKVVAQLAAEYPSVVRFHEEHATCLSNLGQSLQDLGKYAESLAAHQSSTAIFANLVENVPEILQYRERHAISQSQLGTAFHALMQLDSASSAFVHAIEILGPSSKANPKSDGTLKALTVTQERYADMLITAKKADQAEKLYREASDGWHQLVQRSPQADYLHRAALFHVTCPAEAVRDADRAVSYANRAIALAPMNPIFRSTLAAAHYRNGNFSLAASLASESLSNPQGNRGLAYLIHAMAQQQLGQADRARESLQSGIAWQGEHAAGRLGLRRLMEEAQELLHQKAEATE